MYYVDLAKLEFSSMANSVSSEAKKCDPSESKSSRICELIDSFCWRRKWKPTVS